MRNRLFGTLHLVQPGSQGEPESVVASFDDGPGYVSIAIELWRLAGNEARASEIATLLDQANDRDYAVLTADEAVQLLHLLDGLEAGLKASVVDQNWNVPASRLPELRQRTKMLNLDEDRGELAQAGVLEGMSSVIALRNILSEAVERGLEVALD
jgi:hypothetical protein